ncbi:iron-siderophore ABC transporter substrate-binding protein [Oscillatoria sp. FACHB-1407]|nr:iron-siderophore ABC transporter substrate-binding protein [Oscillatoria sp. FACHB-1407]
MGATCVPVNPERLATIFHVTLGHALTLGVKPIASTIINLQHPFPEYLMDKLQGVKPLGSQNEPNLEKIALAKPDLILGWDRIQSTYPLLSQISPTALGSWDGPVSWREYFNFVADVLGKQQEARQAWEHYYQRVDELKKALGNRYQDQEISVVAPSMHWGYFLQAKNSFVGSVFDDIGLKRPTVQDVDTSHGYVILNSVEELAMMDGDVLFVLTFEADEKEAFDKILQSPLGKTLKATQHNRVYSVNTLTWNGGNLLAADAVIDDLFKYLVNKS